MDPLHLLVLLWAAFIGGHLVLSHPPVRGPLRARLGANGFTSLYSAMALGLFVPLVYVWWTHRHQGPMLWMLRDVPGLRHGVELLVVLGFALETAGLFQPAPGSMAFSMAGRAPELRGVSTVTRHPLFVGMSLWAIGHLLMNGWATDVAFFGGFPLMTLVGCMHQDWRKAREEPGFKEILARTSLVPFAAALRGHPVRIDGQSALGLAVGATFAVVLRVYHARLFS